MDTARLERFLDEHDGNVSCVMLTIINHAGGGQPVSMENIRATAELVKRFDVPFFVDGCRFAENAYLI